MKTLNINLFKPLLAAVSVSALAITSHAQTVIWSGTDGEYTTGSNWVGLAVPNTNAGETAQINGGLVNYDAGIGGDLQIHAGGVLEINGGSWTQSNGVSWIQMAGGSIVVAGGIFNQGTAGNIIRNATSAINVSSGEANLNGNLVYEATATGTVILSSTGVINIGGEFKPIETFTLSGGTLNANLVSFADGPGHFILSGGRLNVDGSAGGNGMYGIGNTKPLDFTLGSTGSFFLDNMTLATFNSLNWLNNGSIQYNGAIDALQFNAIESDGGVLISAVPEPSTCLLLGLGLGTSLFLRRRQFRA